MKNIGVKIKLFLLRARVRILDDVIIAQKLKIYNDFLVKLFNRFFIQFLAIFYSSKNVNHSGKCLYIVCKFLGHLILFS